MEMIRSISTGSTLNCGALKAYERLDKIADGYIQGSEGSEWDYGTCRDSYFLFGFVKCCGQGVRIPGFLGVRRKLIDPCAGHQPFQSVSYRLPPSPSHPDTIKEVPMLP